MVVAASIGIFFLPAAGGLRSPAGYVDPVWARMILGDQSIPLGIEVTRQNLNGSTARLYVRIHWFGPEGVAVEASGCHQVEVASWIS